MVPYLERIERETENGGHHEAAMNYTALAATKKRKKMGGDGGVIAVKRKFIKECRTEDKVA
jgi:hypothetical protein